MEIPENVHKRIYRYLGNDTDGFLEKVQSRLDKYTKLWQLSDLSFMPTDTANLLFSCESDRYGSCVLKVCIPGPEVQTEVNCLLAYQGRGYCKLWAYDLSDDVLLLERIYPGSQMWMVEDYRDRARLLGTCILNLKLDEMAALCYAKEQLSSNELLLKQYPTYLTWLEKVYRNLAKIDGLDEVLIYLDKAIEVYTKLKKCHQNICLLHGDLHHENMLLNSEAGYTIIDPKGVADAPVMEGARFLMNEIIGRNGIIIREEDKIREMVAIISSIIGVSKEDLLKSLFIDITLSGSWTLEEHFSTVEAFEEEKQKAVEACKYAYDLLRKEWI